MSMMPEGYRTGRHNLEQNVRERGRRDRVMDNPHASDEELWAIGTAVMYAEFGTWAEVQAAIDDDPALSTSSSIADQLLELREWYDDDRQTLRVDLRQLAKVLEERGVTAGVEYDCGGQWLLHVGPVFRDAEGELVSAVTAGGDMTRDDRSTGAIWCEIYGMSVGTGDRKLPDAEQIQESVEEKPWRVAELADLVTTVLDRELERRGYDQSKWGEHAEVLRERIVDAATDAELAFWAVVAKKFPELTGGDADPGRTVFTTQAMQDAIESLLDGNTPDVPWAAGTAPVIVEPSGEQQAHAADLTARAQQLEGRTLRSENR